MLYFIHYIINFILKFICYGISILTFVYLFVDLTQFIYLCIYSFIYLSVLLWQFPSLLSSLFMEFLYPIFFCSLDLELRSRLDNCQSINLQRCPHWWCSEY